MKLLMEPLVVAAILMKELPVPPNPRRTLLLHQKFQRASQRNKAFSGRGASPSAPCMTWFSLLFSSFFLSFLLGRGVSNLPRPGDSPNFSRFGLFSVGGFLRSLARRGSFYAS